MKIKTSGRLGRLWRRGWIKGLVFFVLLLLLLEVALRLMGVMAQRSRPIVFQEGERKGAGAKTVLCVGDSYTFGGNVTGREAYPAHLWKLLKQRHPGVKVVNGAHCEYNSTQSLYELPSRIRLRSPQVVVILVGSSDQWNLIGTRTDERHRIHRPYYEAEINPPPLALPPGLLRDPGEMARTFRVYKMLRSIVLNLQFRYMMYTVKRLKLRDVEAHADRALANEEHDQFLQALYYSGRYKLLFETMLIMLEKISTSSEYYSQDLSFYFALSCAFRYQSIYSAAWTARRFDSILEKRPDLKNNRVFMKYRDYFRNRAVREKHFWRTLERNVTRMVRVARSLGATPVISTYPITHVATNRILRRVARARKVELVDQYAAFDRLLKKEERASLFVGDDHATPRGYGLMAANIAPVVSRLLDRGRGGPTSRAATPAAPRSGPSKEGGRPPVR